MGPVVIGLFCWVVIRFMPDRTRLEVTESAVLSRQQGWRGTQKPDKQAARNEIRAIHYFPDMISFRGLDNKPIMLINRNYTLAQMLKVAAELHVPLYDHRRWLGLRRIHIGRLAYNPAQTAGQNHVV
jgi:hypothetical protein